MKQRTVAAVIALSAVLAALAAGSTSLANPPRPPQQSGGEVPHGLSIAGTVRSGFSYQGHLTDDAGNPVDGQVDMLFQFWDAEEGGSQVGADIAVDDVAVDSGSFDVTIDVPNEFFDGSALWLRTNVDGEWLTPRQEILPVPYALSLWPGADVVGSTELNTSIVGAANLGEGYGLAGYTVSGDDTYSSAGVYGSSTYTRTFGVLGESEWGTGVEGRTSNPANPSPALFGFHVGSGEGVGGYSAEGVGVRGSAEASHGVHGESRAQSEWAHAGVYGSSEYTTTFGVLGESEWGVGVAGRIANPDNGLPGVVGQHFGTGAGVLGEAGEGPGVVGNSRHGSGVVGITDGDTVFEDAGVRGTSVHTYTYGVHGESEWGVGVRGDSASDDGVVGETTSRRVGDAGVRGDSTHPDTFGVYGYSQWGTGVQGSATYTDSTGVFGTSELGWAIRGIIWNEENPEPSVVGSHWGAGAGLYGFSQDGAGVQGTSVNGVGGLFQSSDDVAVRAEGDVQVQGDLTVAGRLHASGLTVGGPTCVVFDGLTRDGVTEVEVPLFCIDQLCQVMVWTDAVLGVYGPGLSQPATYMQSSADDSWIGGPVICFGGWCHSDGAGVNGDGAPNSVLTGGQTAGGAYVTLYDDDALRSDPDTWLIDFQTDAELTDARYYVCPLGNPIVP